MIQGTVWTWRWERVNSVSGKKSFGTAEIDVVAHLVFVLLRLLSAINTNPRDFAFVVGLHVAPHTASRLMFSTENSLPEIADLGTGC
jgi:hypothetical protein